MTAELTWVYNGLPKIHHCQLPQNRNIQFAKPSQWLGHVVQGLMVTLVWQVVGYPVSVEEQQGGTQVTRRHRQSVHIVPGHGHHGHPVIVRAEQAPTIIDTSRADTAPLNRDLQGNHSLSLSNYHEYLGKLKLLQGQSMMMRKIF